MPSAAPVLVLVVVSSPSKNEEDVVTSISNAFAVAAAMAALVSVVYILEHD